MRTLIQADRLGFKTSTPMGHPDQFKVTIWVDADTTIEANIARYVVEPDPNYAPADEMAPSLEQGPAMRSYYQVPFDHLKVLFDVIEEACRFNPGETDHNLSKFLAEALGDRAYKMGQWITEAASDNEHV